ncbi:MAG: histidine phosphatase family protein [Pseudomonadales bacterium]|nr:histidine phosphatase family protein [Pseudomonadales bacterium]
MRHGQAREDQFPDFDRELTDAGIADVCENVGVLVDRGLMPGKVIASPLVRARQTAGHVLEQLGLRQDMEIWEELVPSGNPLAVTRRLERLEETDNPLLVTHQPFASELIDWLTGERVGMSTAAIAEISFNPVEQVGDLECIIDD